LYPPTGPIVEVAVNLRLRWPNYKFTRPRRLQSLAARFTLLPPRVGCNDVVRRFSDPL